MSGIWSWSTSHQQVPDPEACDPQDLYHPCSTEVCPPPSAWWPGDKRLSEQLCFMKTQPTPTISSPSSSSTHCRHQWDPFWPSPTSLQVRIISFAKGNCQFSNMFHFHRLRLPCTWQRQTVTQSGSPFCTMSNSDEVRSTVQAGGDQNQHHSQEGCKEGQDRQEGPITATRRTIARRRLRRLSPPRRPRAPAKRAKRARKKRRISRKNGQKFDMWYVSICVVFQHFLVKFPIHACQKWNEKINGYQQNLVRIPINISWYAKQK